MGTMGWGTAAQRARCVSSARTAGQRQMPRRCSARGMRATTPWAWRSAPSEAAGAQTAATHVATPARTRKVSSDTTVVFAIDSKVVADCMRRGGSRKPALHHTIMAIRRALAQRTAPAYLMWVPTEDMPADIATRTWVNIGTTFPCKDLTVHVDGAFLLTSGLSYTE